jgi:hypothetical protein
MAKQGNYIAAPTSNANWASGFADSLSDLSDNYRDQAAAKKSSELAAEALAYNRGRDATADSQYQDRVALAAKHYDTAQGRLDLTAKGVAGKEALKQAKVDWVRDSNANFDLPAFKKAKAKESGGLDALTARFGNDASHGAQKQYMKEESDLIAKMPVWKEDAIAKYSQDYLNTFGETLDPSLLKDMVKDLPSHTAQQTAENASTKEVNRRLEVEMGHALKVYNASDGSGSTKGKGKTSGSKVKAYSDILVAPLVAHYESDAWFLKSEKGQAQKLLQGTLDQLQKAGVPANEALTATKKAMDLLTEGDALTSIDNSIEKALSYATTAIAEQRQLRGTSSSVDPRQAQLVDKFYADSAKGLQYATPRNVKAEALMPFQQYIDTMNGVPLATTSTTKPTTTGKKTEVATTDLDKLNALVLRNLNIGKDITTGEEAAVKAYTPSTAVSGEELLKGSRSQTLEEQVGNTDVPLMPNLNAPETVLGNPYTLSSKAASFERRDFLGDLFDWVPKSGNSENHRNDLLSKKVSNSIDVAKQQLSALPGYFDRTSEERTRGRELLGQIRKLKKELGNP